MNQILFETKGGGIDAITTLLENIVGRYLTRKETNLSEHPISVNRQLGLTYRLGHGASFTTLLQLFGVLWYAFCGAFLVKCLMVYIRERHLLYL